MKRLFILAAVALLTVASTGCCRMWGRICNRPARVMEQCNTCDTCDDGGMIMEGGYLPANIGTVNVLPGPAGSTSGN